MNTLLGYSKNETATTMGTIKVNVVKTESGYSASCDLLPGWVVAVTGNFSELQKEVLESIDFYIESAKEDNEDYPNVFKNEYKISYHFDVQSLLCFYQSIFSFSALQHLTGINQRQLSHYATGHSRPRKQQAEKIINGLHKLADELKTVSV